MQVTIPRSLPASCEGCSECYRSKVQTQRLLRKGREKGEWGPMRGMCSISDIYKYRHFRHKENGVRDVRGYLYSWRLCLAFLAASVSFLHCRNWLLAEVWEKLSHDMGYIGGVKNGRKAKHVLHPEQNCFIYFFCSFVLIFFFFATFLCSSRLWGNELK